MCTVYSDVSSLTKRPLSVSGLVLIISVSDAHFYRLFDYLATKLIYNGRPKAFATVLVIYSVSPALVTCTSQRILRDLMNMFDTNSDGWVIPSEFLCIFISVCIFFMFLSICFPACLHTYLLIYLLACLPTYLSASTSSYLTTFLPTYLPVCLSTYLPACHPPACLPTCLAT